ncbi:hypothetical protein CWI38_1519p0010 [Hamiltosporidium tvaerminnensis]|uniref:Uncharacterized protein n=1 Tax=Hamiltosporidium tvaerminnensis TaxID=1176355 RepID=A0A4Q9LSY0_9MICR|nr:hypothetical protein CWI38_1519p0010 [Hamiltosporidium tvaerminnensis]
MLDEIKPKEITEKLLNTNQEKIEHLRELLENVFIVFAGSFIQLDENLTDFSVYNSIKNKECLISEIKNNEFFKIINKIYSKNTWKLPESYTNRILQTPEKSKKCLFHELCRLMYVFTRKIFTFIFDNKELRLPDVMRNRSNYIFPDDCEDFPDDGAERKDILKETFGETPEISPFCDDLKPFLIKTNISFYIYKVEDSIFNDIITKFFEEKKISKKKFFKKLEESQLAYLYNEIENRKLHSKLYSTRNNELVSVCGPSRWLKKGSDRNVFWGEMVCVNEAETPVKLYIRRQNEVYAEIISDTRIKTDAKIRKYDLLANELGLIYKFGVEITPCVLTWNGIVTKYHKKYVKRLQIPINIETYIQSIVLKKTSEPNAEESWERANRKSYNKESDLEEDNEGVKIVERII